MENVEFNTYGAVYLIHIKIVSEIEFDTIIRVYQN